MVIALFCASTQAVVSSAMMRRQPQAAISTLGNISHVSNCRSSRLSQDSATTSRMHFLLQRRNQSICFSTTKIDKDSSSVCSGSGEVRVRGEAYGMREYILLPSDLQHDHYDESYKIASLYANRNVLFGAKLYDCDKNMAEICQPLLRIAIRDAGKNGEQPQAISTLRGLCSWVSSSFHSPNKSTVLSNLINDASDKENKDGQLVLEAVKAIATGVPRPGHSIVGVGTFRDARVGWEALAREYATVVDDGEPSLYRSVGGEIVHVEYLAERSEDYLKDAGGVMLRFYFV